MKRYAEIENPYVTGRPSLRKVNDNNISKNIHPYQSYKAKLLFRPVAQNLNYLFNYFYLIIYVLNNLRYVLFMAFLVFDTFYV